MIEQARARKTQAAPSPTQDLAAGLWAMIPKNQRPLVVIAILIFTGGSGSWLLNLSAIWSLPREVAAIDKQLNEQGEQLNEQGEQLKKQGEQLKEIKALFQASTSRPQ